MPKYARRQIVAEDRAGVYHCIARCVRRAFLCGIDPYTGQDFSHRKKRILDRVRELAGLFAVEVCGYSVRSNQLLNSGPIAGVAAGVEAPRRLHVRASDQGFLPIQVAHYVMLLDWTGRELRAEKCGAIPEHLAPIVDRLGLNRSNWVETVRGFGRLFKQAAGRSSSLVDAVARRSRRWFQGKAAARTAFV